MLDAIDTVINLARDYALETRIRVLIESHREAGEEPTSLVMNANTWRFLLDELEGRNFDSGYFWVPGKVAGIRSDKVEVDEQISFFRGVPILVKDFVADMEVIVGV